MRLAARMSSTIAAHAYEVRPRSDKRGVDLTSDVLPYGRLWYTKPDDAVTPPTHGGEACYMESNEQLGKIIVTKASYGGDDDLKSRVKSCRRSIS
jgi:hypothetical protein